MIFFAVKYSGLEEILHFYISLRDEFLARKAQREVVKIKNLDYLKNMFLISRLTLAFSAFDVEQNGWTRHLLHFPYHFHRNAAQ